MVPFRDIFVGQILGTLLARRYSGMVTLLFDDRMPAVVWLGEEGVTHAKYGDFINDEALINVFWRPMGKLELIQKVPPPKTPGMDYLFLVEGLTRNFLPQVDRICPMLEQVYIKRSGLPSSQEIKASIVTAGLLARISSGIAYTGLRTMDRAGDLWSPLMFLCASGQVVCSYHPTLGRMLMAFEKDLLPRIEKLFGHKVLNPFVNSVREGLQTIWPGWHPEDPPELQSGAAPYYNWAKLIKTRLGALGIPTLAARCFEQSLEKLSTTEAKIIRDLASP